MKSVLTAVLAVTVLFFSGCVTLQSERCYTLS